MGLSVIFLVAPTVVVGWPALCAAIAGAAGALGYKVLETASDLEALEEQSIAEVSIEGSEVVAEAMKRDSQFVITRGDIAAVFRRGADGRCVVHVSGKNKTDEALRKAGQELLGRVTQQYAYNKVVTELKNKGFTVTSEEVSADQTIRIHVSKYV